MLIILDKARRADRRMRVGDSHTITLIPIAIALH